MVVLEALDRSLAHLNLRCTGEQRALNSVENRVYQISLDDESGQQTDVVAKFYRPARWTREQILEEHRFIFALEQAEVSVAAPMILKSGSSLDQTPDGIFYAVFPRLRGRTLDEFDDEKLRILGRTLARMHNVGERFPLKHRLQLNSKTYGTEPLAFLLKENRILPNFRDRYEQLCRRLIEITDLRFAQLDESGDLQSFAIHGDCHLGNILWNEMGPFFVDFDDMLSGPPVQDIWMISRGRDPESLRQRDMLIEGYEVFRSFPYMTLHLVECLRALRMIHFSAWIARRWEDPSFPRMFPAFGTEQWWSEETQALYGIIELLESHS